MRIFAFGFCSFMMVGCFAYLAHAQVSGQVNGTGVPVQISAQESLEWHRNDLFFKARKDVEVKRGDTTLYAASMIARYSDSPKKSVDVYRVEATGAVRIVSPDGTAYGDKAIYEVKKSYAVLTGDDLRVEAEDQSLRAQDKIQYWVADGRLEAVGAAEAQREGDKIQADKMIAIFADNAQGKRVLKSLEALGNVIITTPNERLTGKQAIYTAATNVAELKEDVQITRGPNILEGARAQVNLKTNVSKIFGGASSEGGRVSGTFFPGSVEE